MINEQDFKQDLTTWFRENQRQMPWRETTDPYYIWVSEVMLQQTQVDTVRAYYLRFIEKFPTITALSRAHEDDVLKMWEGLGYYSRARNFHTAAQTVDHEHGGVVPSHPEIFGALKGVGPYTQAAVMSIAFDHPLPTVDGNVFRVWSRLNNDTRDIKLQSTRKAYEAELRPYVSEGAGEFNQSMMELGALICTPKKPLCLFCPVQAHCAAYEAGTVMALPVKTKTQKKKTMPQRVFIIRNTQGEVLIEKRQQKLLHNMWEFPMFEATTTDETIMQKLGFTFTYTPTPIYNLKHQFTHMTWDMEVYEADTIIDTAMTLPENMMWMPIEEKEQYNFPVSMTKIFQFIK